MGPHRRCSVVGPALTGPRPRTVAIEGPPIPRPLRAPEDRTGFPPSRGPARLTLRPGGPYPLPLRSGAGSPERPVGRRIRPPRPSTALAAQRAAKQPMDQSEQAPEAEETLTPAMGSYSAGGDDVESRSRSPRTSSTSPTARSELRGSDAGAPERLLRSKTRHLPASSRTSPPPARRPTPGPGHVDARSLRRGRRGALLPR